MPGSPDPSLGCAPSSLNIHIKVVSVTSENPQDGGSVCCCYDYHVDVRLQKCEMRCVLGTLGCVMSRIYHAE